MLINKEFRLLALLKNAKVLKYSSTNTLIKVIKKSVLGGFLVKKKIEIVYANGKCKIERKTEGAFAFDLVANITEPITIKKGEMKAIPTGVFVDVKDKHIGCMGFIRSGLAFNHGLTLVNAVGVIDSDYRGEIKFGIFNFGFVDDYTIQPFERIGQVAFMLAADEDLIEVEELTETERGDTGFGKSGKFNK